MRIANRTRNSLLGTRVEQANTWLGRLRGFIGRPEPSQGEGILLVRCDAVHTWWMSFGLDLLFLDERGKVLELVRSIPPWRHTRRVAGARYVLEVPVGTIDLSGTQVGDELTWRDPAPYSLSILSRQTGDEANHSTMKGSRTG